MPNKNNRVFKFQCNEKVKTIADRYVGTVYKKHHKCPMSQDWIDMQTIPVNPASINKPWFSIKVDGGGSVLCSEDDILSM